MNPNNPEPTVPAAEPAQQPTGLPPEQTQPVHPEPVPTPTQQADVPAPESTQPFTPAPVAAPSEQPAETPPVVAAPVVSSAAPLTPEPTSSTNLKSIFLKVLIGCLIASAAVSVVAILAGGFGDIAGKALGTIVVVALHSLMALGFLSLDGTRDEAGELKVFVNTVFGVLVLSFITAVLGIWDIVDGTTAWKLYLCYGVLLVAILHGEVLARTLGHRSVIDKTVYANFAFMGLVVFMLWVWILSPTIVNALSPFYLRILAASAIVDGTLTITAIILDRLYVSKLPQPVGNVPADTPQPKKGRSILLTIVMVLLAIQFLPILFFSFISLVAGL